MRGVFLLFGAFLFCSSASAVKVGPCFLKMENRRFPFMEGTVGPLYTTETAEECENICIGMIKCMAYTYQFSSKKCFIYHFYPDIGNNEKEIDCKEPCVTYYIGLPTFCYNISTDYVFYRAYLTRLDDCNTYSTLCKSIHVLESKLNAQEEKFIEMENSQNALKTKLNMQEEKFIEMENALQSKLNVQEKKFIEMENSQNDLKSKLDELKRNAVFKCYMDGFEYDKDTGICYKIIEEPLTWDAAREKCHGWNAELISIHSQQENDLVQSIAKSLSFDIWIGLNDQAQEGSFVWADKTTVEYQNWFKLSPNGGRSENCVVVWYDGGWADYECNDKAPSVCKL